MSNPTTFSEGEGFGFKVNSSLESSLSEGEPQDECVTRYSQMQYKHHKTLPDQAEDPFDIVGSLKVDVFSSIREDIEQGYDIKNPATEQEYKDYKKTWVDQGFKRFTLHAPVELQERLRNISYWTRIAVSDLGCHALALMIRQIEMDFNNSFPYKIRRHELKQGRRIGS